MLPNSTGWLVMGHHLTWFPHGLSDKTLATKVLQ